MQVKFRFIGVLCVSLCTSLTLSSQCESPILQAPSQFDHHCVGEVLEAEIANAFQASCGADAGAFTYCYTDNEVSTFSFCPDEPGDGSAMRIDFNTGSFELGFDNIQIFDGADGTGESLGVFEGSIAGTSFVASNSGGCISFVITTDFSISCEGGQQQILDYEVSCETIANYYTVSWEPAIYLSSPDELSTEITGLGTDQMFTLNVFETANPECSAELTVMVNFLSNYQFGASTDTAICSVDASLELTSLLNGNPSSVGTWYNEEGSEIPTNFNPSTGSPGTYTYSYEFCEENQVTLDLLIAEPPVLDIMDDFNVSCNGESLEVTIFGQGSNASCSINAGNYDYCYGNDQDLFFTYCPDVPGEGNPMSLEFIGGFVEIGYDRITVYDGNDLGDPELDSFDGPADGRSYVATNPDGCISFRLQTDYSVNCQEGSFGDNPLEWIVDCVDERFAYLVEWDNGQYLSDATLASTEIFGLDQDTEFTVSVYPEIAPSCEVEASVSVTFLDSLNIGIDTELNLCADGEPVDLFDELAGNPENIGSWTDTMGNQADQIFDPQNNSSAQYFYSHPECTNSTLMSVFVRPVPNVNAGNDIGTCNGELVTLTASGADTYNWGILGSGSSVSVSPAVTTTYSVTGTTIYGCSATDEVTVNVLSSDEVEISENDGVLSVNQGGQFQWYLNGFPVLGANQQSLNVTGQGTYTVVINPGSNCEITSPPYEFIVGVNELGMSDVIIYPQPFETFIRIESNQRIERIEVLSVDGKLLLSERVAQENTQLDLGNLSSGVYLLKLQSENGQTLAKRILKK